MLTSVLDKGLEGLMLKDLEVSIEALPLVVISSLLRLPVLVNILRFRSM